MDKKVNFSMNLANFELMDYLDEDIALLRVLVVDDRPNAHNLPISFDAIKDAAPTLISKAFVAKYDELEEDVLGHEKTEKPFGYFPKQEFEFVENEDGSHSMYAYAIIFKSYCREIYSLFTEKIRDEESPVKAVSMEIRVLEGSPEIVEGEETTRIDKFEFKGVTLLGSGHMPAIYAANAELITFEQKIQQINSLYFSNPAIKINNSKEAAVKSKSWVNPRKKVVF